MKYSAVNQSEWKGRETDTDLGVEYWYQLIECLAIDKTFSLDKLSESSDTKFGIVGYACDAGVRRNKGRVGAKEGPKVIREQLAKLAVHQKNVQICDMGDFVCEADEMEETQAAYAKTITHLLKNGITPIGLGGGHDLSYAHWSGIRSYLQAQEEKPSIGIINFDAHFDLRALEGKANSGTPFRQILEEVSDIDVGYFALGIQKNANTASLFTYADTHPKIHYKCLDELNYGASPLPNSISWTLSDFMESYQKIYLTIDLDGFAAPYAPGVSAVSAFGLTPAAVAPLLNLIAKSGKLLAFDVAEMNPSFDLDNRTAKLAAQLIDLVISSSVAVMDFSEPVDSNLVDSDQMKLESN